MQCLADQTALHFTALLMRSGSDFHSLPWSFRERIGRSALGPFSRRQSRRHLPGLQVAAPGLSFCPRRRAPLARAQRLYRAQHKGDFTCSRFTKFTLPSDAPGDIKVAHVGHVSCTQKNAPLFVLGREIHILGIKMRAWVPPGREP